MEQPLRLRDQSDFSKLWFGQTVSEVGSWLGALPLLAILQLGATPAQMGLLETLRSAPVLLIGLFAGVWVDRLRRRPLLILADLGRALLLALVVWTALAGQLRIEYLYLVAPFVGALGILFSVAYRSYLPALVNRAQLIGANSRLSATASAAEIAAPGLGGLLAQTIGAPLTMLLDALSFVISALFLGTIRAPEGIPLAPAKQSIWHDITAGLHFLRAEPRLRALAGNESTHAFFGGFFGALYMLYGLRTLSLTPALVGLTIGAGGIGALAGALLAGRVVDCFGTGHTILWSSLLSALAGLLVPLAGGPVWIATAVLIFAQVVGDTFLSLYFITAMSLRQTISPDALLGRVNASFDFLAGGVHVLGLLAGGFLGQIIGIRASLTIAAVGMLLGFLWLWFSPLRHRD